MLAGTWQFHEVPWPNNAPAAAGVFADGAELAWLDGVVSDDLTTADARYSLVCTRPIAILEQFEQQPARLVVAGRVAAGDRNAWALWRQAQGRLPQVSPAPSRLSPGWVGYVGFELARQLERLPASHAADLGLPLMRMALFDRGIVLDHHEGRAFAVLAPGVAAALGANCDSGPLEDAHWLERWHAAAAAGDDLPASSATRLRHEVSQAAYEQMVARAIEYIAAGDIYQVNLSQRLRLEGVDDALAAYAAVRGANPAPYAALLRWDGGAVASLSPELFLRLRGEEVLTRPIKGTRPRTGDPAQDEAYRRELLGSEKEAAELAMIIDLHRNDLGRVCRYGSVRVAHPRRVEAHPTVFHTVADVVGRLGPGRDGLDLLAACFPAGSISGVPKIRAIQIIDELEPVARGAYTGAVGVLGLDGQMMFNVAIRTLQIREQTATLYVGGGIVADSDPAAEYEETLAKARGILSGVGVKSSQSQVATRAEEPRASARAAPRGLKPAAPRDGSC